MRILVCTHEADIDGIYSASIALMKFPSAQISFHNNGFNGFKKMFDHLKFEARKEMNGLAIISDLGINDNVYELCLNAIKYLKKRHWSIIWVDHHPWNRNALLSIKKYIKMFYEPSGGKCSTEIMYKKFMYKDKNAEQLKMIAHSSDFMTSIGNYDSRVSELILFYRNSPNSAEKLLSIVQKTSLGILWDSEMQKDYTKFANISNIQKARSLKTLKIKRIKSFYVAFVFTYPLVQVSLFSQNLLADSQIDLVILFNRLGKVSIRRNNTKISCGKIASFLVEGGGHEFASGGMLKCDPRDFNACVEEIKHAIASSLC